MSDEKPKLVKGDSGIDDAEVKMLTEGPFITIDTPEMLMALAQAAQDTKEEFDKSISAKMTLDRAKRIRALRVEDGLSWRGVARRSFEEWGKDADWDPPTNQLAGMALCEFAANALGEDYMEKPWN